MKKITIEWFCYEKEGRSCVRCEDSSRTIRKAVDRLASWLRERGIAIDLRGHRLDDDRVEDSNSIAINGKDVMTILRERQGIFSYCRSCTELNGRATECRTFIYRNKAYESVPEEMITEAILKEVSS